MRFLVDAQLPPALARWLGERGHSATAVRDAGLRDSDGELDELSSSKSNAPSRRWAIPDSIL
jgi:predicted nuclease of predicted toxin-antitoxin system